MLQVFFKKIKKFLCLCKFFYVFLVLLKKDILLKSLSLKFFSILLRYENIVRDLHLNNPLD